MCTSYLLEFGNTKSYYYKAILTREGQDRNCHQKSVKLLVIVIVIFKRHPSTCCLI